MNIGLDITKSRVMAVADLFLDLSVTWRAKVPRGFISDSALLNVEVASLGCRVVAVGAGRDFRGLPVVALTVEEDIFLAHAF